MRSGSPITYSPPASSIAARRSASRVTMRTAWPSSRTARVRVRARQPPPTTSRRAIRWSVRAPQLGFVLLARDRRQALPRAPLVLQREQLVDLLVGEVGLVPALVVVAVLADGLLDVLHRALRHPAPPAALVGGVEHLGDVVDLILRLHLGRARRAPPEHVGARARVEGADEHQRDDDERRAPQHDDRKRIQPTRRIARRAVPCRRLRRALRPWSARLPGRRGR